MIRVNVLDELRWRGLLYDRTEGLDQVLASESVTAYIGFDPTGVSLHAGNMVSVAQGSSAIRAARATNEAC